ncbi:pilus assembly protein TadG-related protein [Sphingomonas donggukensis]|uniref:Pilus assembly protein TadG-related protein n=1 Tax=Sphingomonas donggukensis TaxID=2949093 RepID=A0ABY4TX90_9SPHN|nr:TadE/TadG family type IV pilus assembly protein [Sphingomonas donggukensis]URW76968.1 pilus assembly protein TadG-related protein [Sphingomonas donggukensis]
MWGSKSKGNRAGGLLSRLARDVRGNALMIMAAALIPLAGMVGGGIDVSRMYILKTRLQHACDAGSLAGRRTMGGGTWAYNNNYANSQAEQFFDGNFESGSFGSSDLSRVFTESAGRVTGTVSAKIPMTLMRIFGKTTETIAVTCATEMRLPNTDIMFVLDTTGSMAQQQPGDTVSKMDALKTSVKCFYEIVARNDTDANCTTGTPSGGVGNQVQVRFGFMPYSTNVNVGKLLPIDYFADTWKYQTRKANMVNDPNNFTWVQRGQPKTTNTDYPAATNVPQSYCSPQQAAASGYNSSTDSYSNNNTVKTTLAKTVTSTAWTSANGGTCTGTRPWVETVYDKVPGQAFQNWTYDQLSVNVGLLKNGNSWRDSFKWPIGANGTDRTITWDGCIEERQTTKTTSYNPIPSAAKDMNIDLLPSTGDDTTRWGPALQELIYARQVQTDWNQMNRAAVTTTAEYYNNVPYYCPTEARKLQEWPSANQFDDYVDSLQPSGNTYHDIGLIWGARFASPTGIFASENATTKQGGEIERHIIFMTDGDACTNNTDYAAYGMPWFDRRQTSDSAVPTGGCTSNSYTLVEQVNKRTEGLCAAIKNKNITLWVIAFGDLATETETRLSNCATSGRYFKATSASQLQQTFKSIADQISMLRLTQ